MGSKSFLISQLWVLGSLVYPFLGLALTFLYKAGACQRGLGLGSSHCSEWGAHFCFLHPLTPVGAIAVWGLLGGLAGT